MIVGVPGGWWGVAGVVAVLGLAVCVRRRFPITATVLAMAAATVCPPVVLAVVLFAYGAGRRLARWWQVTGGLFLVLAGTPLGLWAMSPAEGFHPDLALQLLVLVVLPWLVGRYRRERERLRERASGQARRWEREQALLLERARARERARIAADMHDALGHDLGLIALLTGALASDSALLPAQRDQAVLVRRIAGEASERLHDIVELLAPGPPEELTALVDRANVAGASVRLSCSGEPTGPSPQASRLVHAVVREAITNATRHAPGHPVVARVAYGKEETAVEIENPLAPTSPDTASAGGGTGLARLAGLVERNEGRLTYRHTQAGRFVVTARVPHQPPAVGSDPVEEMDRLRLAAEDTVAARRTSLVFWRSVAAPAAAFVTVIAGYSVYVLNDPVQRSAMTATAYSAVRLGQPWSTAQVPEYEAPIPPSGLAGSRAGCHHYARRTAGPLVDGYYRVCTVSGRIVSKAWLDG